MPILEEAILKILDYFKIQESTNIQLNKLYEIQKNEN